MESLRPKHWELEDDERSGEDAADLPATSLGVDRSGPSFSTTQGHTTGSTSSPFRDLQKSGAETGQGLGLCSMLGLGEWHLATDPRCRCDTEMARITGSETPLSLTSVSPSEDSEAESRGEGDSTSEASSAALDGHVGSLRGMGRLRTRQGVVQVPLFTCRMHAAVVTQICN